MDKTFLSKKEVAQNKNPAHPNNGESGQKQMSLTNPTPSKDLIEKTHVPSNNDSELNSSRAALNLAYMKRNNLIFPPEVQDME